MKTQRTLPSRPTKPINYAVGMFGTSIPINMFRTFAFIFLVDYLSAITATQFALIITIYTIIDAIDNPLYGFLSDSTRSRWGRRRPYLVLATPLLALSFISFFNVPTWLGAGSVFWYALIMYSLTGTLDAMINVNYGALFPELFRTLKERGKTNAFRQAFQFLAMIISIALTPLVVEQIGYHMTAMAYSALAVIFIMYMAFNVHETPEAQALPKPKLLGSLKGILSNPKFWMFGLANASFFAALSILQQLVPFYARYVLDATGIVTTILLGSVILCAIIGIPIWLIVLRKKGLMTTWRLCLLILSAGLIPLYFTGDLISSLIPMIFVGFAYGGASMTLDLVGARILDEDREKYGVQREGTFNSLGGVLNRTSNLFVALGFVLATSIFGYISGDEPGPRPEEAARFLLSLYPLIIMVACCIFAWILARQFKKTGMT
jgi:GPH family glycoside/pentoside/hexuronide:cation symporter